MTEQHQELGTYFFTKKTKAKEPLLGYDTAKKYFSYALQDDFEKLFTIFSNQINAKNFKMFMYFVEINGDKWCDEFRQICNDRLRDWSTILTESKRVWSINDFRVKVGKNNIRVLAKHVEGYEFDIEKYSSSACSTTNEYCLRVKSSDDLRQIVELKFANFIQITECHPDMDLSIYSPDVIESKIANYLVIRENCKKWTFKDFQGDFQFFLKNRERRHLSKSKYDQHDESYSGTSYYGRSSSSYNHYT